MPRIPGISGGVSFFTYLPTTPSLMDLSLLFRDFMLVAANCDAARDGPFRDKMINTA